MDAKSRVSDHAIAFGSGALLLGAFEFEARMATLVALVVGLLLLGARRREFVLAMLCYALAAVSVRGRIENFERQRHLLREELRAPTRCVGEFVAETSPTARRSEERSSDLAMHWVGSAQSLECDGTRLERPLRARLVGGPEDLARGDRLTIVSDLGVLELWRNPSLPSPLPSAARRGAALSGRVLDFERSEAGEGFFGWVDRYRSRVRARILATFPEHSIPLARALVLGESDLSKEESLAFAASGLSHLLAVSGTHLVIAVGTLGAILRGIFVRIPAFASRNDVNRWVAALTAFLAIAYAEFSGASGSAYRAAFMLVLVSTMRVFGRRLGGTKALLGSLVLGMCIDPLYAYDLSFLLSLAATSGLLVLGRPLSRLLARGPFASGVFGHVRESLVATFSASLFCGPVLAFLTDEMSLVALVANVVAAPFGEVFALPACLLHAVSAEVPSLERGLALVGGGALLVVRKIALLSASLRIGRFSVPFPSAVFLAEFGLAVAFAAKTLRSERRMREKVLLLASVVFVFIGVRHFPETRSGVVVEVLDIGQGDSLAIHFPGGEIALLDGGGSATAGPDTAERVLLPYLRKHGKSAVDLMILSHAHPDHYKGLLGVARKVPVREFWHPEGAASPFGEYRELLELVEKSGGVVRGPAELCEKREPAPGLGGARNVFGVRFDVLAPCPGPEGMGLNDESLVLRMHAEGTRYLFTGDVEEAGEARLLRTVPEKLRAEVLKIGHHGSRTSSGEAFVRAVSPEYATISCGIRNRFGHPRSETLETLGRFGITVHRTDLAGGIRFVSGRP